MQYRAEDQISAMNLMAWAAAIKVQTVDSSITSSFAASLPPLLRRPWALRKHMHATVYSKRQREMLGRHKIVEDSTHGCSCFASSISSRIRALYLAATVGTSLCKHCYRQTLTDCTWERIHCLVLMLNKHIKRSKRLWQYWEEIPRRIEILAQSEDMQALAGYPNKSSRLGLNIGELSHPSPDLNKTCLWDPIEVEVCIVDRDSRSCRTFHLFNT